MKHYLLFFFLLIHLHTFSQTNDPVIYRITSTHTSFPDTARANGHEYNQVYYHAATHYTDSSVLIMVPANYQPAKKTDLVCWFHGWGNNIDTAARQFHLITQFAASNRNAILVLPETTRDAPDSYGGKLEYQNTFRDLISDVINKLKAEKVLPAKSEPGNILLAGHSGAYRVMSFILQNGNLPVQEVLLFDALYAQTDKFIHWIRSGRHHRFIDIYTDGGGTDGESKSLVKQLLQQDIPVETLEEQELTGEILLKKRIVFIHSLHKHNDIICNPDNFRLFLENSPFLKKITAKPH